MRSLVRSIKKFSADDMLVYASALSYQLFFSLFPFVIFLLALLGVLDLTSFFDWLLKQSQTVLPGQASRMVQDIIEACTPEPLLLLLLLRKPSRGYK